MTSPVDMNSVLLQMRAMSARARSIETPEMATPATGGVEGSFGTMFKQAIEQVNATQQRSTEMAQALETGASEADIAQVMLTMQKASLGFQALTQVRNKVVAAYQEVMSMQV